MIRACYIVLGALEESLSVRMYQTCNLSFTSEQLCMLESMCFLSFLELFFWNNVYILRKEIKIINHCFFCHIVSENL